MLVLDIVLQPVSPAGHPMVGSTAGLGENPQVKLGLWGRAGSNGRPLACKTAAPERHAHLHLRSSAASVTPTVIRCLN
jgi:hypothetical protein